MEVTIEQWREQIKANADAVIIDVRRQEEVDEGHMPKAIHIDVENPPQFMEEAQKLDPNKSYYVYCKTGDRSTQACMVLGAIGFNKVYKLDVGFDGWIENGGASES